MIKVFLVQLLAAGLGGASTALADCAYRSARITRRAHSVWVAASIAAICLPVLVWACDVFLGPGVFGRLLAAFSVTVLFAWVYGSLQRLPVAAGLGVHPLENPASASGSQAARRGRLTF